MVFGHLLVTFASQIRKIDYNDRHSTVQLLERFLLKKVIKPNFAFKEEVMKRFTIFGFDRNSPAAAMAAGFRAWRRFRSQVRCG